MFSRKELKDRAKAFLRVDYFSIFLVVLFMSLPALVMQVASGGMRKFSIFNLLFMLFVPIVLSIFVLPALEVGIARYLLDARERDIYDFSNVLSVFSSNNYFHIIKIMFLKNLYTFLWTLLFIIPGVMKSYEYRFIPFILARDMDNSGQDAFLLSREYTNNNKLDIFILDMSFMGWAFLGAILLWGVGVLFVAPYIQATNMELFLELSESND